MKRGIIQWIFPLLLLLSSCDRETGGYLGEKEEFELVNTVIPISSDGKIHIGDWDQDGLMDIIIIANRLYEKSVFFFHNKGDFSFIESGWNHFDYNYKTLLLTDADADGKLEANFWSNSNNIGFKTIVDFKYYNSSNIGPCISINDYVYLNYNDPSLTFGDYDNDGYYDLACLISTYVGGEINVYTKKVKVRKPLELIKYYHIDSADMNNDGQMDIVMPGYSQTKYHMYGLSYYFFESYLSVYIQPSDYDNDGDIDCFTNTYLKTEYSESRDESGYWTTDWDIIYANAGMWTNDGDGNFKRIDISDLNEAVYGPTAWGDYDNDGDLDLAVGGIYEQYDANRNHCCVYENLGNNHFKRIKTHFLGIHCYNLAWADLNCDGRLDLIFTGYDNKREIVSEDGTFTYLPTNITQIYMNKADRPNTPPGAPINLSSSVTGNQVELSWEPAFDKETPRLGLTYDIRLKNITTNQPICSGNAMNDGRRLLTKRGFIQDSGASRISHRLTLSEPGKYRWSVQAVDTAFAGSKWADGVFIIE